MREIKFRAWDRKNKKWIDLSKYPLVLYNDGSGYILLERDCVHGDTTLSLEDLELMQFTGLKDKNGKEIFEGDIVTFKSFNFNDGHYGKRNIIVEFNREFFQEVNLIIQESELEIIGNKFENPELLEDGY